MFAPIVHCTFDAIMEIQDIPSHILLPSTPQGPEYGALHGLKPTDSIPVQIDYLNENNEY
jgi:hypothetical protein